MAESMLTFDRLPLTGECQAFRPPGHPVHVVDIIGLRGRPLRPAAVPLWRGLGVLRADQFAGWRRPVVAPAEAMVLSAHDGEPDRETVAFVRDVPNVLLISPLRAGKNLAAMAGNHVILEARGGFVLLAHLRRDSVTVGAGEAVDSGAPLGEVGNSGNALLPHLHVQTMTTADPFTADALPWQVTELEALRADTWHGALGAVPLRIPMRSPR